MKKVKKLKNYNFEKYTSYRECTIDELSNYLFYLYYKVITGNGNKKDYKILFDFIFSSID